jgi:hypothetical protein
MHFEKTSLSADLAGLLKIFLSFARKTHDNIGGKSRGIQGFPYAMDSFPKTLGCVTPSHGRKDFV